MSRRSKKFLTEANQAEEKLSPLSSKQTNKTPPLKKRLRAQDQISYEAIAESGLAWLGGNAYSVTLKLSDINYQLLPEADQASLVEKYARFLNAHLPDQHLQVTIINRVLDRKRLMKGIAFGTKGDNLDVYRKDYDELIASKLAGGRNNTVTDKYITIRVEAESVEEAKIQLSRIAAEAAALLRDVGGCTARQIDGVERIRLLQSILRPGIVPDFSYSDLVATATTSKDYVCPWSIDLTRPDRVVLSGVGEKKWQTFILRKLPPWLSDRIIKEISDIPLEITMSIHIDPIDQGLGLRLVKEQIASMDMQRSNGLRKLAKQGLGEDFLSHELLASSAEAKQLRSELEQSNEKLFTASIVLGISGVDDESLNDAVQRVNKICAKHSCQLETLKYMQLAGLNALLPLGVCDIPVSRTITTAVAAVLIPFTTQELLHKNGLFYGVNTLSKNLIQASRLTGLNANGFILGTSGSGKSYIAKSEMMQLALATDDEIIIVDPEREYPPLAAALNASRIIISAGSKHTINALALDKSLQYADIDPIRDKCTYILSLIETLLGGEEGLSAVKRSILDRAARQIYSHYWNTDNAPEPTFATLYTQLLTQAEPEAKQLAVELEFYAKGSASGFAKPTNVDTQRRVTVFDLADLGADLQTFGMMVILEEIWRRIIKNKSQGRRTWVYIDEFHLLFNNEYAAQYCKALFKRVRKYGAAATGITQNIAELLSNDHASLMLANADTLLLLNQEGEDADELQARLNLSEQMRSYFTNASPGTGLLRFGPVVIPFDNQMNPDSKLFKLFSTDFNRQSGGSNES